MFPRSKCSIIEWLHCLYCDIFFLQRHKVWQIHKFVTSSKLVSPVMFNFYRARSPKVQTLMPSRLPENCTNCSAGWNRLKFTQSNDRSQQTNIQTHHRYTYGSGCCYEKADRENKLVHCQSRNKLLLVFVYSYTISPDITSIKAYLTWIYSTVSGDYSGYLLF